MPNDSVTLEELLDLSGELFRKTNDMVVLWAKIIVRKKYDDNFDPEKINDLIVKTQQAAFDLDIALIQELNKK